MRDPASEDHSAAVVMTAAESPKCYRHPLRDAKCNCDGMYLCSECEHREPSWVKRVYLAVALCLLVASGCVRRARPEPVGSTMDRYYETYQRTQRHFDAIAIESTLAKLKDFDEAQTRDHLAAGMKAAGEAADTEAGGILAEIEATEFETEWTQDKARALYGKWLEEIRGHE